MFKRFKKCFHKDEKSGSISGSRRHLASRIWVIYLYILLSYPPKVTIETTADNLSSGYLSYKDVLEVVRYQRKASTLNYSWPSYLIDIEYEMLFTLHINIHAFTFPKRQNIT